MRGTEKECAMSHIHHPPARRPTPPRPAARTKKECAWDRGTFHNYFDTSCFVNPAADSDTGIAVSRGNAGWNIITMPGDNNWDASIFKKFILTESKLLEFRKETFNGFNHPQWNRVNTWDDTGANPLSTFGRIDGGWCHGTFNSR